MTAGARDVRSAAHFPRGIRTLVSPFKENNE